MIIKNRRIAGLSSPFQCSSRPGRAWRPRKRIRPAGLPGTWCSLGKVTAGRDRDHDTIEIKGSDDEFRALKFKVKDSPLNIQRMVVTYDNGAREEVDTRNDIPKGGESRNIDLRGSGKRSLKKVEFWYESAGPAQRQGRGEAVRAALKTELKWETRRSCRK